MSDNVQCVDELIVCLVGMGFELEDCQQAVTQGKLSVQQAVDWILAGKPESRNSGGASNTLRLGQASNQPVSSPLPFAPPIQPATEPSVAPSVGETQDEFPVVSRSHLNEEQRKIKERFEEKQREEAKRSAQVEKIAQKKARAQALQQIQEDREKRQRLKTPVSPGGGQVTGCQRPDEGQVLTGMVCRETGAACDDMDTGDGASPSKSPTKRKCMIQVRLPNGKVLRQSLSPEAVLRELWDKVKENMPDHDRWALIQAFPRKEYSTADLEISLEQHGLSPSGSLFLKKIEKTVSVPHQDMEMADTNVEPLSPPPTVSPPFPVPPMGRGQGLPFPLPPPLGGPPSGRGHSWGSGHKLEDAQAAGPSVEGVPGAMEHQGVESGDDESAEDEAGSWDEAGGGPGQAAGGLALPGLPPPGGPGWNDPDPAAFESYGRLLDASWAGETMQQPHQSKDPKQLAAEAASRRFAAHPPEEDGPSQSSFSSLHYHVPRLTNMLIHSLSGRICDSRNPVTSLQGLPAEVATHLLEHLIKTRLLRAKTLNPFISCHLKSLVLDSYPYVTNELLTAIRLHTSLTNLSLASCPLITDKGLLVLDSLKKLKHLSLLGCKQLTDGCFAILKELPSLVTLVLEDTGITDDGLMDFCTDATGPVNLQYLDLSRTRVSNRIMAHLKRISNLRSLCLEHTNVMSLAGVQELPLDSLNVANTAIVTDSLLCLANISSLRRLNLSNTAQVEGDVALQYIRGLKLQVLQLPSRHTTTVDGIRCIRDMPLVELDLTNYINIQDDCLEIIGCIHSLKKLRLTNTKITDGGMPFLEGLGLLEELLLDRTAVTDNGASVINGTNFPHLLELSLAQTSVSNNFLLCGCLNTCTSLSKLNLSKNSLTSKGVQALKLPSLVLLNLDHTNITNGLAESLKETPSLALPCCPKITRVLCSNTHPVSDHDE